MLPSINNPIHEKVNSFEIWPPNRPLKQKNRLEQFLRTTLTYCFYGRRARDRTADRSIKSRVLYQLSYAPLRAKIGALWGAVKRPFAWPVDTNPLGRLKLFDIPLGQPGGEIGGEQGQTSVLDGGPKPGHQVLVILEIVPGQ